MPDSGDDSARLKPDSSPVLRRHRRCRCCLPFALVCVLLLLVLVVVAIVLAFTVFKVRDPTTQLLSVAVSGVSPRVTFPNVGIKINVTLDLEIRVNNPNRASFAHALGHTVLNYRGTQVGDADVAPGRIPSRGSEDVAVSLTVEADRFASDLGALVADVVAGEVTFDASTRIPGRVSFLGVFKHHAVALSECHVTIGIPDLKVRKQECTQRTKL